MGKKRSSKGKFQTTKEMDDFLESNDLSEDFEDKGEVQKPRIRKVNLDLPEWLIEALDQEASRLGISRQPLMKIWLAQKLEEERKKRNP